MIKIENQAEKKTLIKLVKDWESEIGHGSAKEYIKSIKKGKVDDFLIVDGFGEFQKNPIYSSEEKQILENIRKRYLVTT